MTKTRLKPVSIAGDAATASLSKGQKTFNRLIKQIDKQRARLAAWEAALPQYQQKYASDLHPLLATSTELQVRMVHCLDRACGDKALSSAERRAIAGLITELVAQLLAENGDAALKAIYNKHSRSDYDRDEAASLKGLQSVLEEMLDIELGDDLAADSPEELMQRAEAQVREKQAQHDAELEAREQRRARRKKTAKQLAREAQQAADEQQLGQSIREVYRKLASALHPDRETDLHERARKTALMQRVNEAYARNNLLQLLELQLELEHIDQAAINNLSEDRLKHYNKILSEQVAELDQEIHHVEARFRSQFGISPYAELSPATLLRHLAHDIADLKRGIRELERDLLAFADIKNVKAWLKEMRRQAKAESFYDAPF